MSVEFGIMLVDGCCLMLLRLTSIGYWVLYYWIYVVVHIVVLMMADDGLVISMVVGFNPSQRYWLVVITPITIYVCQPIICKHREHIH